jgi:hypothetical protein
LDRINDQNSCSSQFFHGSLDLLPSNVIGSICECQDWAKTHGKHWEKKQVCCVKDGGDFHSFITQQRTLSKSGVGSSSKPNNERRFDMYNEFKNVKSIRGARIPLPKCYCNVVKEIWPDTNGKYKGFNIIR